MFTTIDSFDVGVLEQLPLLDDTVDLFMSRDADSPLLFREEDTVRELLASDRMFHVTREHPKILRSYSWRCYWFIDEELAYLSLIHSFDRFGRRKQSRSVGSQSE